MGGPLVLPRVGAFSLDGSTRPIHSLGGLETLDLSPANGRGTEGSRGPRGHGDGRLADQTWRGRNGTLPIVLRVRGGGGGVLGALDEGILLAVGGIIDDMWDRRGEVLGLDPADLGQVAEDDLDVVGVGGWEEIPLGGDLEHRPQEPSSCKDVVLGGIEGLEPNVLAVLREDIGEIVHLLQGKDSGATVGPLENLLHHGGG